MSRFLVRIELHDGNWTDYDLLHDEMAALGFSREVTSDEGVTYHLPTAEYTISTSANIENVRASARSAAQTTGRKAGVFVAEYSRSAWTGLAFA